MSEIVKPHIYETLKSRELSEKKLRDIARPAVELLVESDEKIVRAKRVQKVGYEVASLLENRRLRKQSAAELSTHRKEIHNKKLENLTRALDQRKENVQKAKSDVKFAQKGYGVRARRAELKSEAEQIKNQLLSERSVKTNSLGAAIEKLGIRREAKIRAEQAVAAREKAAAEELKLRTAKLELARAQRSQTRSAYWQNRFRVSGKHSNRIATASDMVKDNEQRLADLKARDRFNDGMNKGKLYAERVKKANEEIDALSNQSESTEGTIIEKVEQPESPQIDFKNIGEFVPGATAAFVEAARDARTHQKAAKASKNVDSTSRSPWAAPEASTMLKSDTDSNVVELKQPNIHNPGDAKAA